MNTTHTQLTTDELLDAARDWAADCLGAPVASVDDARAVRYVRRWYPGGWRAFESEVGTAAQYPVIPS